MGVLDFFKDLFGENDGEVDGYNPDRCGDGNHEWIVPERGDVLRGTDAVMICKHCRKLGYPEDVEE